MADSGPPGGGGDGGGGFLSRRTAGIPGWGWVALAVAGGVVALLWLQSRKTAAPATTPAPAGTDTTGIADDQYQQLLAQLRDLQGAPSTPTTPATPTYSNNSEWYQAAINWYRTAPNAKFGVVKMLTATNNWLTGQPVWSDELGEIQKMIVAIGAPPDTFKQGPVWQVTTPNPPAQPVRALTTTTPGGAA